MKQHLIPGAVAAAIAGSVTTGALHYAPRVEQHVTHSVYQSKHAWPDLSSDEVIALGDALATLKDTKIVIMTNDASGADLAEDIDDAVELADRKCNCGVTSVLDHAVVPFGYGIGVIGEPADKARVATIVAALNGATGGRLQPIGDVGPNNKTYGNLVIAIGKHRAN